MRHPIPIRFSQLILVALFLGCGAPVTRVPTPTPAPTPTVEPSPLPPPTHTREKPLPPIAFPYAASFAVPAERAIIANSAGLRAELRQLKTLGINIVEQSFTRGSTLYDWRAFLDVAAQEAIYVIPGLLDAPPTWNGTRFDLGQNEALLRGIQNHPALYAILILDDPFHPKFGGAFTTDRLQLLYQQIKQIAPNARVMIKFNRGILKAEQEKNPRVAFQAGLCDICAIGALEFRDYGDGKKFRRDDLLVNHNYSRALIKRQNPQAQLWTSVQVFGAPVRLANDESTTYYLPPPGELQQAIDLILSPDLQAKAKLDGIVWQQWSSDTVAREPIQFTLRDLEFAAQRDIVKALAKKLGLPTAP